jgi:hypothetical protein
MPVYPGALASLRCPVLLSNRDEALGLNNWALPCSNGHDYLATSQDELCKECGQPPQDTEQALMFPRFAYTTAAWDPPKPPGRNLDRVGEVVLSTAGEFTLSAATKTDLSFGGIPGLLRGSPSHDAACRRACLECLLDFGGQSHAHLLDRKGALVLLDAVLGDQERDN